MPPGARNLYHAYLAHFDAAESGPTTGGCFTRLADLISPKPPGMDESQWAEFVPWHQVDYPTALAVRKVIVARVQAEVSSASYANKHLAALRGVINPGVGVGPHRRRRP